MRDRGRSAIHGRTVSTREDVAYRLKDKVRIRMIRIAGPEPVTTREFDRTAHQLVAAVLRAEHDAIRMFEHIGRTRGQVRVHEHAVRQQAPQLLVKSFAPAMMAIR